MLKGGVEKGNCSANRESSVRSGSLLFFLQSASQSVSVDMPTPSLGKLRWNELFNASQFVKETDMSHNFHLKVKSANLLPVKT